MYMYIHLLVHVCELYNDMANIIMLIEQIKLFKWMHSTKKTLVTKISQHVLS